MTALRHFVLVMLLLATQQSYAGRLALVIGNSAYVDSPLKNPVNDAREMATKLSQLGFVVTKIENLKRDDISRTLRSFAVLIRPGDDVAVFYAGHGVQLKGINYLPAVDARIEDEADVALNSLNLNDLLDRLDEAKAAVKIVILDACRNNPYARGFRSTERGLARIANAPSGTLIHYATRPGKVAADGSGANGLYTTQLLKALDAPGQEVEKMFKQVAIEVKRASKGEQEPWVEGSLDGEFVFNVVGAPSVAQSVQAPALPERGDADFSDLEKAHEEALSAKQRWAEWQKSMVDAFDRASRLNSSPQIEVSAWERFLSAYGDKNPNTAEDERMRADAQMRLGEARQRMQPIDVNIPPAATPIIPDSQSQSESLKYVYALSRMLSRDMRYPEAAARSGQQGTTLVLVRIGKDGKVTSATVQNSSGHAELDAEAIAKVYRLGALPPPPVTLRGREFTILMPLRFALQ